MKVLVINWRDIENPEAGGAEIHIDEILKRKPEDISVDFVSAEFPGCAPAAQIHGYPVERFPDNFLFHYKFKNYWKKIFSRRGYDLVIDDISKIPLSTPKYIRNTPILAIQHHIHGKSLFKELSYPLASYVYWMERLRLGDYRNTPLVAVSESTRNELLQLYPFKCITVSHNGIEFELLRSEPKPLKNPVLLYMGRLKRYKRVDHLIRAFQGIHREFPGSKLVIAGKGDDLDRLKALTAELRMEDSVEFTGFVPEERKADLLSKAHVFMMASEKEGWGITVIEANAAALPVVSYDVEGLRDSVQNGYSGLLCENGNIEKLTESVLRLLKNPDQYELFAHNAVEWASRFSWDNMANAFWNIARKTVKDYGARHA